MKLKFKWIYTLLLALSMQFSFAQEKTVSGVVSDASGPIPGANVVVKGTKNGVQTDFDGKFAIKAKVGDVLMVSFVGMQDASAKVGTSNTLNFKLQSGNTLDEVVVVGYGTQKKREITGSISQIKGESIKGLVTQSFDQQLAGRAAGVQITQNSGLIGSAPRIRIRGINSINSSTYPLIVVDGSGTNYTANTVNVGFGGAWNSVEIKSTDSSIDRLANGQFLITATFNLGYLNESDFVIPTGSRGYDLADAPKSITTRILMNAGKTQVLAQAVQVNN